jgi:recombination protein RecT
MTTESKETKRNGKPEERREHPYARFRDLLERPSVRDALVKVLPKHLTADRMFKIVQSAMSRTPKLYECTPDSVLRAVMQAAELGLEIGGVLGEAYLVPTWNKRIQAFEADFRAGYRGFVKLALDGGFVKDIDADVVRANDVFRLVRGSDPSVVHEPNIENDDAPILGVYAIARYANGGFRCVYMPKDRVEKIRARSQAAEKGFSPWATDWEEMAKKTAIRNLLKLVPLSGRVKDLAEREDERDYLDVTPEPTANLPASTTPALPPVKAAGKSLAEELRRARSRDDEAAMPATPPHDPETGEVSAEPPPDASDAWEPPT